MTTVLANARIVLADEVVDGNVAFDGETIVGIDSGPAPLSAIDLGGDYLLPGLVDIHTDHFERHLYPRAHVRWDPARAAMAHDAQIIGAGITTVFDSLCVGATIDNPHRREILAPMLDALEKIQDAGMLRASHLVHLRCELSDLETTDLTAAHIGRDIVRLVSVMEHVPGRRQLRDIEHLIRRNTLRSGDGEAVVRQRIEEVIQKAEGIEARVRPEIVRLAHAHGLPLLSHDDTELDHVTLAVSEGISVSEFPCTLEAARLAREHGMIIVAGAPNILRGGSQSGNVAASDLMAEGLVDIFASDYVPRSMFDCAFTLAEDPAHAIDLPRAIAMISKTPAEAAGLDDRGEIAIGRRADLLQCGIYHGHPYLKQVWRQGKRVL